MRSHLHTDLTLTFCGEEKTFSDMVVTYWHHRAVPETRVDPGVPEHVELGEVYVADDGARNPLPQWMVEAITPELERLCLEDWRSEDTRAREYAAEGRRELNAHSVAAE
jgi:hypothetical protein